MISALLIGCGNIGANYDFNSNEVLTYAKAFYLKGIDLTLFDVDLDLSKKVASKYDFKYLISKDEIDYANYAIVCVASSTNTHFEYLQEALKQNVKTIICEKPISLNNLELSILEDLYNNSTSKVFVNYIRRFQPVFNELKLEIEKIRKEEKLIKVIFNYKKGFLNNASHGLDLIEYLLDNKLTLNKYNLLEKEFDFFKNDPTCSFFIKENDFVLNIIGFSNVDFSVFEMTIYYEKTIFSIMNSGNEVTIKKQDFVYFHKENGIKNYMLPIIDLILASNSNQDIKDNFFSSLELNEKMNLMIH
jgi:predicted dehydrogenase